MGLYYGSGKKRVLQKAEIAANFPKEALYGSQSYDGYIFQHPYTNQGIEKIATVMQETVNKTQTGDLILATAEGFRLELGTNKEMSKIKWDIVNGYITDSWYKGIIDFVHKSNKCYLPKNKGRGVKINRINRLEIREDIAPINKQRQNDSFIMEAFIEAKISTNNLFILNIIRMFLKAVTVSDIATSDV